MDKVITIIKKSEQEKADKEYWQNASVEERFKAFNIILQNYIALTYGTDPGFQRVINIVKREQS
ncbi:MAG: toxin secretion, membrane fusion protein [Ignavibacteria bacterium]|nr:toxin secretion, membrane fusion protein [Ignavibacteria bacterium]